VPSTLDKDTKLSIALERAAILLVLTETREEEDELRKSLSELFNIRVCCDRTWRNCSESSTIGKTNEFSYDNCV